MLVFSLSRRHHIFGFDKYVAAASSFIRKVAKTTAVHTNTGERARMHNGMWKEKERTQTSTSWNLMSEFYGCLTATQ